MVLHQRRGKASHHGVAIIGAGPYGLSLAAHLRAAGVDFKIFGRPMQMWHERMPRLMHLKSEPFATDLYDPGRTFPLSRFCRERGIPYQDVGLPVSREIFCQYGNAFQRRFVPDLDERSVTYVTRTEDGFELEIGGVERVLASKVVMAVGISHFSHIPESFAHLSSDLISHSSMSGDLSRFKGRRVAVIGGGSSAIDCSVMLAEIGAETHLVTRRDRLAFHTPPSPRSLYARLRWPMSTVGPGWKSVLFTRLPDLFQRLPKRVRFEVIRRFLGPAPCWFTREAFERDVTSHKAVKDLSLSAVSLTDVSDAVSLDFVTENMKSNLVVDHVVAATGFRTDLRRLTFLDTSVIDGIEQAWDAPVLDRNFETSVPGLFFVGPSAAYAFGPMLRFACGAGFAARRITRHLRHSLVTGRAKPFVPDAPASQGLEADLAISASATGA